MTKKITGILLTGGKSSRMGEDKANTIYKGKYLAQWSKDALSVICDEIIVSSNNLAHGVFGDRLVTDIKDIKGPLAGLAAALEVSQTEINVILACDTPNVTPVILQELVNAVQTFDASILVTSDGQRHPLIGCYKTNVLKAIRNIQVTNRHSMMHLLDHISYTEIPLRDATIALNVNTKNELYD